MFAAAVTFVGCWFVYTASPGPTSKLPEQEYLVDRMGILTCGVIDLALSAAMWCRDLGAVMGLTAWALVSLTSWVLIMLIVAGTDPGHDAHVAGRDYRGTVYMAALSESRPRAATMVATLLFVAAILAFFKKALETWNVEWHDIAGFLVRR